ncbi:MAG: discoidin domain-containing protein [Clostridia bacterium]|nr:discoidin domain-containing protein [Clostridia bacterium]
MKKFLIALTSAVLLMLSLTIVASADTIAIEAEDFTIHSSFSVEHSDKASGGNYIAATVTNAVVARVPEDLGPVNTEAKITINETANYSMYIRIANPAAYNGDSMYFIHDNVVHEFHFGVEHTDFYWKKVAVAKFEAGEHTIRLYAREMGGMMDKVIITSDPFFQPTGMGEIPETESVLYDNGSGDLRAPLPAVVPPNEHPRLLVRKSDLPRIRENLTHPQNIGAYERLLEKAQSTHKGDQASYSADLLEIMQSKAFLYLVNGDVEMGRQAVEMVMNHIERLQVATSFASDATMRSAGHAVFSTSCVYDWCYDLFTPEQRATYIQKCEDLITLNFEGGFPNVETQDIPTTAGHSVENPYYRDQLAFAIAVYDEKPFIYNNLVGVLNMNYFPLLNWYYPSHWMTQGVSTYGDFRYVWEMFCAYMLETLGQKPFPEGPHYSIYKSIYWRRPDGHYFTDSDETRKVFDNTYVKNSHALYFMAGNRYKDPYLKWQYYKNKASTDYVSSSLTGVTAPLYLIMNDTTVELNNRMQLPLTKYYPSPVGNMMARTSWEEGVDSPAVLASMKPQETYFSGHTHVETGNFTLYYKGMLALDSGSYEAPAYTKEDGTYVAGSQWGSGHYMNYLTTPIAHNVLMVYDPANKSEIRYGGQTMRPGAYNSIKTYSSFMGGSNKTAENLEYDYGPDKQEPEYSWLESDLSYGYKKELVKDYTRSYMFLNLFDEEIPAAFIIFDRVESTDASLTKSWLLHSQEEPKIEGNKVTIDRTEWHNSGRLTNTVVMPQKYQIDKVGGPGMEYWDGQANLEIYRQPIGDESGSWRIEVKPAEKKAQDYFLNVIQVSDPDDSIAHHEVTSNEQGEFVGVFLADRAVFMKKNEGKVSRDFTVTADGEGDISYIITNLAEGRWTVTDASGNEIASETVADEHGVLRFRTKSGTYKVHWDYEFGIEPKVFDILDDAKELDYTPVDVFINDKTYDRRGRLEGETIMLVLEDIASYTNGSEFSIDGSTFTAKGRVGEITGTIGSTEAVVNGEKVTLSVAPAYFDDLLYIPMDECMKNVFEYVADYDSLTYILYFRGGYYMVPGADFDIINVDDRNRADVITTTCSEINAEGNEPNVSLDNNYSTYWCSSGAGEWIIYELAETYDLTGVGLAWASGHIRQEHFAIHVSEDGEHWTEMWRGDSSGKTDRIEDFKFKQPVKAKYVKLECNENTVNQMNSLYETHIYCTEKIPYYEK